jgi:rubrerythrin
MATCSVRWRSSGGRGEFEFVPAETLADRDICLLIDALNVTVPAEVRGLRVQGKPRLRKFEGDNRSKLHLPQLVMALARLPEPAREDKSGEVKFPLENKTFVMDAMEFDIIDDDGLTVTLEPLKVSILHTDFVINLQDRFKAIAADLKGLPDLQSTYPGLAIAIKAHADEVLKALNTMAVRKAADDAIKLQTEIFGKTNAGSALILADIDSMPASEIEAEILGKEGRLLTRLHSYRERDRAFAAKAKKHYKDKNGDKLICEACGLWPVENYGPDGEKCIEAHHKIPIEQLQPDSITSLDDMAMVCASCHRMIHTQNPCLPVESVFKPARQS